MFADSLETLWFSKESYLPGTGLGSHTHKLFHYIYIIGGSADILIGNMTWQTLPNTMFATPPGVSHSLTVTGDKPLNVIEIKFNIKDADKITLLSTLPQRIYFETGDVRNILLRMVDEGVRKETYHIDMINMNVASVLISMLRANPEIAAKRVYSEEDAVAANVSCQIDNAVRFISGHLSSKLTLDELAAAANMSRFHFSRYFKSLRGVPPKQYVLQRRLEKAKELLLHSDMNISQTASSCGFEDIHYFSRFFRQKEGMSPQEFIAKYRRNMYFYITQDNEELLI